MRTILQRFIFIFFTLLTLSSLAFAVEIRESQLDEVKLGMSKNKIIALLGEPDAISAEGGRTDGKTFERIEYSIVSRAKPPKEGGEDTGEQLVTYTCFFEMADGVLVRIGRQEREESP